MYQNKFSDVMLKNDSHVRRYQCEKLNQQSDNNNFPFHMMTVCDAMLTKTKILFNYSTGIWSMCIRAFTFKQPKWKNCHRFTAHRERES